MLWVRRSGTVQSGCSGLRFLMRLKPDGGLARVMFKAHRSQIHRKSTLNIHWKNWCFWTVVLEKTLESPLDCKEIQPVHLKGSQSWIFIGRTDAEAEAPILWPFDAKSQLIRKDSEAGKDWQQEEKGATEDEIVGWHHRLNGHEFVQTLGDSERQGSLACCSPWGRKESDVTERLNNNDNF